MMKGTQLLHPDFAHAWEQRKLGPLIKQYSGKSTNNNQYPVLTSSRKGLFLQSEYYDGNQIASKDNTGYNVVPYGYFTYRHMSDDEIFKFNINTLVPFGIVSTLYPVFNTTESLDSKYLQYQLNHGSEFSRYAKMQKQGGSRTYMYFSKLQQLKLTMPNSIVEQGRVSGLVTQMDNTIALHQRKLDLLQKMKKGYLQSLFPKNGEKTPEIRFAGFTDAWEQRKLGDIAEFLNGRAYKQTELLDTGKYPVLRVGNFNTNDKWFYSNLELPDKNYANNGDLLYTWATAFGPHIWKGPKVIYHYHIWKVQPTKGLLKGFTLHLLDADQTQMTNSLNGSTMVHITKGTMENKSVSLPIVPEQNYISSFLDKLDTAIALHQRKMDELKEIKQGLLQKMFV